jgi:hypothetical protein
LVEIPESLLRRSAEAKAKALGVPVDQVLAEMKGEGPPVEVPQSAAGPDPVTETIEDVESPVDEVPEDDDAGTPEIETNMEQDVAPVDPHEAEIPPPAESAAANLAEAGAVAVTKDGEPEEAEPEEAEPEEAEPEEAKGTVTEEADTGEPAPVVEVEVVEAPSADGAGNGKVASTVSPRPSVPPAGLPEGVRTQRLLTVVKARAIQSVRPEPTDKVNTWPHLMLMEFGALLLITGVLVIMSVVIHSPLLDPANFNNTPNPSKAPWYFLGLQELLSYFDPQIAGVMVPLFIGLIGFMMIPYVDKNPSTRPSDRKFAIMLFSLFLAGSATLTMFGVLFRGQGFNFSYPWRDGVFFDDLRDWVHFE